jgi:serine/threonine-protein kinase
MSTVGPQGWPWKPDEDEAGQAPPSPSETAAPPPETGAAPAPPSEPATAPGEPAPTPGEITIEGTPGGSVPIEVAPAGEPAAQVEPTRPRRHRAAAVFLMIGIAIAAFGTGLFAFNNVIMPRLIHSVGEVRVPDLGNLTVEQGEKVLQPLGLTLSRSGERFDPSVPRGFITSQDPPAETPVRGKKRVLVVVSLGEEFSSVPALFGESVRSARYLLERAGLRSGGITRAPSDDVGEGLVVSSDPPGESVLPRDTPVSLLVSAGVGEESFVMPDLLGREITGARRQLESLGFRVFTPPAAPSIGTIVLQDPAAGSRITRNSTVLLQATGRMIR